MVTRVKATTEYRLLANADNLVRSLARDSLVAFSINKLRELKLVTANFKNGFDFSDGYYIKYDRKKFYKIITNTVMKAFPFLEMTETTNPFLHITGGQAPCLRIKCVNDKSIYRYIRRINRHFTQLGVPYTLNADTVFISDDVRIIDFTCYATRNEVSLETYKLMMLIPEALKILKTLSRKARFQDEHVRALNRCQRVGYQAQRTT